MAIESGVPFCVLGSKFSLTMMQLPKHMYLATSKAPLETIFPIGNGDHDDTTNYETIPTYESVTAVHYKLTESRETQFKRKKSLRPMIWNDKLRTIKRL